MPNGSFGMKKLGLRRPDTLAVRRTTPRLGPAFPPLRYRR